MKLTYEDKKKLFDLNNQFLDPIIAIEDDDWKLPDDVLKIFYAVYNLIEAFSGRDKTVFGDSSIYISINQAIDSLETSKTLTEEEIKEILDKYKIQSE